MVEVKVLSGGNVDPEAIIDEDIDKFDQWFQQKLDNEPLVRSERAIIKTYIHWKTHPKETDGTQASS